MWKNRYIQLILSLLILTGSVSFAQTKGDLARLYKQGKVERLHAIKSAGVAFPGWQLFLESLFEPESATAIKTMAKAYGVSDDLTLRTLIQERVGQFYSAQGYYETARRINEDPAFFTRLMSVKNTVQTEVDEPVEKPTAKAAAPESGFAVQVGAFSNRDSALKERERYLNTFPSARVLSKEKNGSTLYIVAVGANSSRSEAEMVAEKLMNRFKVKGYIIQF
ncbi:MAG: SPOR domain-containing protein [Calditrichia bacterium]